MHNKCFSKIVKRLDLHCDSSRLTLKNLKHLIHKIEKSPNPSIINGEYVNIINTFIKNGCIVSIYLNNESSITLPRILFNVKICHNKIESVNSSYYMNNCDIYRKVYLEIPGRADLVSPIPTTFDLLILAYKTAGIAANNDRYNYIEVVMSNISRIEGLVQTDKLSYSGSNGLHDIIQSRYIAESII